MKFYARPKIRIFSLRNSPRRFDFVESRDSDSPRCENLLFSALSKTIIIISIFLCFSQSFCFANFLDISKIGIGARSIAMGRAQAAALDVASNIVNPANSASINSFGITSMYTNMAEDAAYSVLSSVIPIKSGALGYFGVGYIGAGVTGISITTSETRSGALSTTDYNNSLVSLSYSRKMNSMLNAGLAIKFLSQSFGSISNASGNGISADLGAVIYPQDKKLSIGVALQNILSNKMSWASGTTKEDINPSLKMGINYKPSPRLNILADYDSGGDIHTGAEWLVNGLLKLRGGIEVVPISKTVSVTNYSAGLGLAFGGVSFDYAYYVDSTVSTYSTQYFSVSYDMPDPSYKPGHVVPAQKKGGTILSKALD